MNQMNDMNQYQPGESGYAGGFGTSTLGEVDNLSKALEATHMTGGQSHGLTTASGAALKYESLDPVMKVLTFTQQNVVIWKNIPKKKAHSTSEEYNVLSSYGQNRGGFTREGELPMEEDSIYVRKSQLVKYIGVTKSVTHQMLLVNVMGGDPMAREVENATLWVMRRLEQGLINGDEEIVGEEFNGLYTQHQRNDYFTTMDDYYNSEVVVDLRGFKLSETSIEKAAEGIVENFGFATKLYAPPKVLSDFVTGFYGNKFMTQQNAANGVAGQRIQSFESQYGSIGLEWDLFMNPDSPKKNTTSATSQLAPAAPTADATAPVTPVAATDPSSKWGADDAGSYFYGVTAINRHGESAVTVLNGAAASIVANGAVDLKFAATASANGNPTAYKVYRSNKGAVSAAAATFYPLFTVPVAKVAAGYDGGAANIVRDRNRIMPGTMQAYLIQEDSTVLEFAELLPLIKMDLALNGPAFRFMVLKYGTPLVYAPKRMVRFVNVGTK